MSAGLAGHFHGTKGTRPLHGSNPHVEVSRQISVCLLFFLFSPKKAVETASTRRIGGNVSGTDGLYREQRALYGTAATLIERKNRSHFDCTKPIHQLRTMSLVI